MCNCRLLRLGLTAVLSIAKVHTTVQCLPGAPTSNPAGLASNLTGMVRVFLVGDVMLGRGVDQILQHHVDPTLHEDYVKDARDYVTLAVEQNGALPESRGVDYVWGDAIEILQSMHPDVRIINLETSITTNDKPWPNKGIHYRMHPKNVDVIKAAKIDCCVLSNNHVLDWGYGGLHQTLDTLAGANISYVGAGRDLPEAIAPAIFPIADDCRVLIFGWGHSSSGVPEAWAATERKAGVNYIDFRNSDHLRRLQTDIENERKPGDTVIVSIHWGSNWDWDVDRSHRQFAHRLIDDFGVDLIHGHSSHHIKGVEVHGGKLIIYGCGDFISDYEGISSSSWQPRDDVSFMYFVDVNSPDGSLAKLTLVPMRLKHMQVCRATGKDADWLFDNMNREVQRHNLSLERGDTGFTLVF